MSFVLAALLVVRSGHLPAQAARLSNSSGISGPVSSFGSLISRADNLVRQGNYAQALSVAQQAVRANASDYRGYYYEAFALFKTGAFDEARAVAEEGKRRASSDKQQSFERLTEAIAGTKTSAECLNSAQRAIEEGDANKAAELYNKAYEAMPTNDSIGIKAARIYGEQLDNPSESIRILKQVLLRTDSPITSKQVSELISKAETRQHEKDIAAEQLAAREAEVRRRFDEERARARDQQEARERDQQRQHQINELQSQREDLKLKQENAENQAQNEEDQAAQDDDWADKFQAQANDQSIGGQIMSPVAQRQADKHRDSAARHRREAQRLRDSAERLGREMERIDNEINKS